MKLVGPHWRLQEEQYESIHVRKSNKKMQNRLRTRSTGPGWFVAAGLTNSEIPGRDGECHELSYQFSLLTQTFSNRL